MINSATVRTVVVNMHIGRKKFCQLLDAVTERKRCTCCIQSQSGCVQRTESGRLHHGQDWNQSYAPGSHWTYQCLQHFTYLLLILSAYGLGLKSCFRIVALCLENFDVCILVILHLVTFSRIRITCVILSHFVSAVEGIKPRQCKVIRWSLCWARTHLLSDAVL